MNHQLRFFMSTVDESHFVAQTADLWIDRSSDFQWSSREGRSGMQFVRCRQGEGVINVGRIALRTSSASSDDRSLEERFRRLVRQIKRGYSNDLLVRNIRIRDSSTPVRNVWVGPDALRMAVELETRLTQTADGPVVFEVANRG
jgi:hypothetical protein